MGARPSFCSPYQDPSDSTTPQPSVLIVDDVEAAVKERLALDDADRREGQFYAKMFQSALAEYLYVTHTMTYGSEKAVQALVEERERRK